MNKFDEKDFNALSEKEKELACKAFDSLGVIPMYYDPNEVIDPDNDSRLLVKNILIGSRTVKIKKDEVITMNHNHQKNITILTTGKRDFNLIFERRLFVRGFIQMGVLQLERVWYEEDISDDCKQYIQTSIR